MYEFDLDLAVVGANLAYMLTAYALALPVGWDRESRSRGAGLRTFPLVAAGACAFALIGRTLFQDDAANARLVFGIITGIGFIGGGSIVKDKDNVHGTATAASIWNTGAIGVAIAWNRLEIAILLSLLNFLTFRVVSSFKSRARH